MPKSELSRADLARLLAAQQHATVAQRARDALRTGAGELPRPVLLHALAIALVTPIANRRGAPAQGTPAGPLHPSDLKDLEEAAGILEELLCLDGEARGAADSLSDTAESCAWCFIVLRRLLGQARPVGQRPAPEQRFVALLDAAGQLVTRRRLPQAEALLSRAREVALAVEGEAGPGARAAIHVLRVLREYLGDRVGAAIPVEAAAQEAALDEARLAYGQAARAAYLQVVHTVVTAAWQGAQFELARRLLLPAMTLYRHVAAQSGDGEPLAQALLSLGRTSLGATSYGTAFLAYEELRRLSEAGSCAPTWREAALAGLGRAWIGLGDLELGRVLLAEALGAAPRTAEPGWHSDALLHAYEVALEAGDGQTATACHQALARSGNARGSSLAEIEARALEPADPARALALYEGVLNAIAGEPERGSAVRRILFRVAQLHAVRGETDRAYDVLRRLHEAATSVLEADHPFLSEVEGFAAVLEDTLGRPEYALHALSRATARDSRAAVHLLQAGPWGPRNRVLRDLRRRVEAAIGLVAQHFPDAERFVGGVHAVAMRRKGLNLAIEWQKARHITQRAAADPAVREAKARLVEVRARLAREALDRARGAGGAGLAAAVRDKEAIEREIAYLVGGFSVEGLLDVSNPASVAMTLPEDSAYLDVYRYTPIARPGEPAPAPRYCAFVILARYLRWQVVDLGEAARIDRLVAELRAEVATRGTRGEERFATVETRSLLDEPAPAPAPPGRRRTTAGHRLRRRILDRLQPVIGERTRLVVSLDGPLLSVPLDSLPTDDGGHVLDRWCISYVASASSAAYFQGDVIRSAEEVATSAPSVVLGDPAYTLGTGGASVHFRPLPGSRREAMAVAALLGVPALLGPDATKAAVTGAASPLILHLATHGYVLGAQETDGVLAGLTLARTGLAFAGANGAAGGILLAEEVLSLDLQRTALAVLSACETGLGEPEHGEGLASLGRAFETAGARAVLVGLWKVPDEATRELMEAFYHALAAGAGCAEAVRQAKLAVKRRHPAVHDWGAFVCFGGWGSIAIGRGPAASP